MYNSINNHKPKPVKGTELTHKAKLTSAFHPLGNNVNGYDDSSKANKSHSILGLLLMRSDFSSSSVLILVWKYWEILWKAWEQCQRSRRQNKALMTLSPKTSHDQVTFSFMWTNTFFFYLSQFGYIFSLNATRF